MAGGAGKGKRVVADDHDHGGGHEEIWLVSYADLMTLLFGFFVLMYTFASAEKSHDWEKVKKEFSKYFGSEYFSPYEAMKNDLMSKVKGTPLEENLDLKVTDNGLEITFRSTVLFELGQAEFSEKVFSYIMSIVGALSERIVSTNFDIVIEGHTDDNPISTLRFPSNWELSAARATRLARLFEKENVPMERIKAIAYGESRPLFANRNSQGQPIPENQAQNRRVVIRLVSRLANQIQQEKSSLKE